MGLSVNGEVDVPVEERLSSCRWVAGLSVFCGAQEPVEGDNDEVDDVLVERSKFGVFCVEQVVEFSDDRDVCWVGSCLWVVVVSERLDKRSVHGMELGVRARAGRLVCVGRCVDLVVPRGGKRT